MSQITWKSPLETIQSTILMRLQIVMSVILTMWEQITRPPDHQRATTKKRYAVKARPVPVRVKDSVQILELTRVLGSAEDALVVWTLRGWLILNEAKKHNFREGRFWTYDSLPKWCAKHFQWLSAKQLSTVMTRLEKQGVIIRKQFGTDKWNSCYWYSIDETVLSSLVAAITGAGSGSSSSRLGAQPTHSGAPSAQTGSRRANSVAHTTKESTRKESSIPDSRVSQTTTAFESTEKTDVVVVTLPIPEPESESGEHSIEGEGPDTTAVKAFVPHEQHHNDQPISKVALKVLSPLAAELATFGVLLPTAQRLVGQYAEADIRRVLDYARGASNLINPPGFVVDELDTGKSGVLAARIAPALRSLSTAIIEDAEREERMRRETERLERLMAEEGLEVDACHTT